MTKIYINGKFAAQQTTGVQRVASQIVQALDSLVGESADRWVLLHPQGARPPALRHIRVREVGPKGFQLHGWEQLVLPRAARDGLLLNLAASAPYRARSQAVMLHDAAVFDVPHAYKPAFVWWYRRLFRRLAQHALDLFVPSEFSRARLALRLSIPASRITVIPSGCDHLLDIECDGEILDRHGLQGQRFLLAVGTDNPNKNLAALIAAFSRLGATEPLQLVLVGGHESRAFSRQQPTADPHRVVRTGHTTDAQLKALYQHASAFVFPSCYEGFGLPPLEAMSCGCPVAAARAASIPEVCGEAALYFDPGSVDQITASLQQILSDAKLRGRLKCAGLARASGFRWRSAASALLARLSLLP